jgi:hypothetical protein
LKLWRVSTLTSTSVFGGVVKPMRGDVVETRRRGSRGVCLGEDEGQERIGLGVRVTPSALGTDLAVAQTPGVPFGCCLDQLVLSPLAVVRRGRSKIRALASSRTFGFEVDEVSGPAERRVLLALSVRWLVAVAAERFGGRSRAFDSL